MGKVNFKSIIEITRPIYAVYRQDPGQQNAFARIYFAGLDAQGYIHLITGSTDGLFESSDDEENFVRFYFGEPPTGAEIWS